MVFERWGSLSVDDHVNAALLAANVLLYDRLVVPVMTAQPDRDEKKYWKDQGWDPDLQKVRLEQFEDLAIHRPWNAARRQLFKNRLALVKAEKDDAKSIDVKQMTRTILAQEQVVERPAGVSEVTVIAAYNSAAALEKDFKFADARDHLSAQAYLLTRRLAAPDLPDPEDSLAEALKLSRDPDFREKRAELFDWQETMASRQHSPQAVVERITEMVDAYNDRVESAFNKVTWKLAFTICGIGLGFATGGAVGATAAAALSLVQFTLLDSQPAVEPGSTRPVAMFQDIEARVGLRLRH
jgi:hypothetical protein